MYHFNEGSLALPADWNDKTIHVLTASSDDSDNLSFTISRDTIPWAMSFAEFTQKEIRSIGQQLTQYKQIQLENGELLGKETATSEFSWQSSQGHIHQLMMFIHTQPQVLIFTASMAGILSETQKEKVKEILSTLTLRD